MNIRLVKIEAENGIEVVLEQGGGFTFLKMVDYDGAEILCTLDSMELHRLRAALSRAIIEEANQ